jgi:hypothetical protein
LSGGRCAALVALTAALLCTGPAAARAGELPPPGKSVLTLTVQDSGRSYIIRRGTLVVVNLPSSGGPSWDAPESDAPEVLTPTAHVGGYPAPGPVSAEFRAATGGTAHLSATTDAPCLHSKPHCMIAQRRFRVRILVGE